MPWQNQGGGGGGWQNGNRGPWGQGPQGPSGGRGNQPPDLEDLIKKGQERLKSILPGSGGSAAGRWGFWPVVLAVVVAFWAYQCVYTVAPDEQGVVLRFGKYERTTNSGLHFILWPVEQVTTVGVLKQNILTFAIGDSRSSDAPGLMLAGDQNIVDIEYSVLWKISDPRAYLFNVQSPNQLLRFVAESAMREYVGRTDAEDIRTKGREAAQEAVRKLIQDTLDSYNAGITIEGVQLNKAEPPQPVMDAFAEVNRAQQDSAKFVNEATQYSARRKGQANGEAAKIREDANAYKGQVVAEAQGEAQRFLSVYDQYKNAKDVTRQRIYLETMEDVLGKSHKVVIEPGVGVLPYLPLPESRAAKPPVVSAPGAQDQVQGTQQ